MNSSGMLFGNRLLDVAIISCFIAQFYKVFSPILKGEKIQWARLIQTGGMPSSHASTVVSLSTGVWLLKGTSSIEFAISMVFSSIVLYDATGIRRQAGKHAKALNRLVESIEKRDGIEIISEELKEFLGHTPIEVFWGCVLGVIIGVLFKGYILG
ncbi:MAG: divergent PAP2 family protein [Leptotrichiaceae bacterium]|nr:divergent PAP2 family protein [Leptotrichiaceae bacterium]